MIKKLGKAISKVKKVPGIVTQAMLNADSEIARMLEDGDYDEPSGYGGSGLFNGRFHLNGVNTGYRSREEWEEGNGGTEKAYRDYDNSKSSK